MRVPNPSCASIEARSVTISISTTWSPTTRAWVEHHTSTRRWVAGNGPHAYLRREPFVILGVASRATGGDRRPGDDARLLPRVLPCVPGASLDHAVTCLQVDVPVLQHQPHPPGDNHDEIDRVRDRLLYR